MIKEKDVTIEDYFQFITCPKCSGFGYALSPTGKHKECTHCGKKDSVYGFVDGKVLHWDKEISKAIIAQEKTQQIVKSIINIALIIIGILGALSLAYYFFTSINNEPDLIKLLFTKNNLVLFFWISIVTDLYIYYRLDQDSKKKTSIIKRPINQNINLINDPLNWNTLNEFENDFKVNVATYFDQVAEKTVENAYKLADSKGRHQVENIHLLVSLLENNNIILILTRLGIPVKDFINKAQRAYKEETAERGAGLDFGLSTKQVFISAYFESYLQRRDYVSNVEILLALIKLDEIVREIFDDYDVDLKKVYHVAEWVLLDKKLLEWGKRYQTRSKNKPKSHMNRSMTARPTKMLDSVSQDFTIKAKYGQFMPLVSREKEVQEAFRVLKEGRGNVILLGDSGVGKTTIIEGIAQLMSSEDVPANLQDKRLVVLDPGALIAGAQGIGGVEERMIKIIYEIMIAGNVILAIEDIHNLLGAKSTGSGSDAAEILMNFLSQGYIQVIGTSTVIEYQKYISEKETFLRRFQVVKILEMDIDQTIRVLEAKASYFEAKYHVFYSYEALEACAKLSDRYIKDRHLPSKALDILEESAIYTLEKIGPKHVVSKEEVAAVLSEKTNVEVSSITASEADKLLNLEDIMHERIVGQHEAIEAIAKSLRRAREELRDPNRPIASFLFLGSTGVGKTETAKTIAETYFGNEKNMIRIDMSEYQDQASIVKMIGDPNTKGYLTEAVKKTPYGLILLDEIEKAHPDILNLFLQVMDDGRLTDGQGKTADFTNSIIIATSNAATNVIEMGNKQGLSSQDIYEGLMDGMLEKYFRPEFLNRFDRVVVFSPLQPEEVLEITKRMLIRLAATLQEKGIILQVADDAIYELAEKGYNPKYGARPLRRLLQDTVDDALAKLMLQEKLGRRDVVILHKGGELEIIKGREL